MNNVIESPSSFPLCIIHVIMLVLRTQNQIRCFWGMLWCNVMTYIGRPWCLYICIIIYTEEVKEKGKVNVKNERKGKTLWQKSRRQRKVKFKSENLTKTKSSEQWASLASISSTTVWPPPSPSSSSSLFAFDHQACLRLETS